MTGLSDFTFLSELKYPEIIKEDTADSAIGVVTLETDIPLNSRVIAWYPKSIYINFGGGSIANDAIWIAPNGDLQCYGGLLRYKVYAGY